MIKPWFCDIIIRVRVRVGDVVRRIVLIIDEGEGLWLGLGLGN